MPVPGPPLIALSNIVPYPRLAMNDADSELQLDTTPVDEDVAGLCGPETAPDDSTSAGGG